MKKVAILIMIITVISKLLGFGRDIALAYYYGASNITDAYLISTTIPAVIFVMIGTGITTSFIPMYNEIEANENTQKADEFTNNLINLIILFCTITILLSIIFTVPIVKLFASGFEKNTLNLAVTFTKVTLLGVYFNGLTYVFSGYLNIKKEYIIPSSIGIPLNFFTIISIALSSIVSIKILAYGTVFAMATQLIYLVPFAYRRGYRYLNIFTVKDKYIKKMMKLSVPVIIGISVNQVNLLIDRTIASQIIIGGISALNYANKLNLFIQGIFVISVTMVMYPLISKMASNNNIAGLKKILSESINTINLLLFPSAIGSMVLAEPVVNLLFGRGSFDSEAIILTSSALFFYSVGMIGFGLREVLSRAFYAVQDTKTPMINAAIGMILNIFLNIILSQYMGISGLALATSISALFTTALMFISLRVKIGPFGMKKISISSLKILFASLVMGGLAKLIFNYLVKFSSKNISLLIAIGVGALSYFVIIYFMKIEDVHVIVGEIKKKIGRRAA